MNEFSEGDLIEATKGETVIRARVIIETGHGGPLRLNNMPWSMPTLDLLRSDGYTLALIEKAAPALPTEPGVYVEAGKGLDFTKMWRLADNGKWLSGASPRYDGRVAEFAPFIRLEPVADTAKKVTGQILARGSIIAGTHAVERHHIQAVAAEFGVSS